MEDQKNLELKEEVELELKPSNVYSTVGLIFAFFQPIVGMILSILGLKNVKTCGNGKGTATAGLILSIVNIVFLGNVYKNPVKVGKPFLVSSILYFVLYAICELPIWVYNAMVSNLVKEGFEPEVAATEVLIDKPAIALERIGAYIKAMDGTGQLKQLPVLIVGIIIYAVTWAIVYKRACKQFQAYDI